MTLLRTQPYLRPGAGGGGGGGLYFRNPPDEFTGNNIAACRTARNTYFALAANSDDLGEFQDNQSLAIILNPTTGDTEYETYLPGDDVGDAYDATKWVDRTDAIVGRRGATGAAGADGSDGTDGTAGADGADGADGTDGSDGATGATGAAGAAGADGTDGDDGTPGSVGPIGPVGPGTAGTPTSLSRFEAVTTANTTAQALSATYADILEIAATDIFANVGGFTVATASNISTITVPNSGLFKITAHIKVVATGSARVQVQLRANVLRSGVVVPNSGTIMGGAYVRAISNAASGIISGTTTLELGEDDTVTFQLAEEANTSNTYTIGGVDSVVEIVELPSEIVGVEGPAGVQGDQGILFIKQYQNAATIPTAGTGGTYVISTGILTPSTGWFTVDALAAPGAGEDTWFQEAEVNPATATSDSITPSWSVVLEAGGTGAAGTDGVGVPAGGTVTQILAKASDTDYDTEWVNSPTGGSGGLDQDEVDARISLLAALLAGATFTGDVEGVTPADDDNSTKFATTEFVADGFDGASFSNLTRRLVLSRLGGGTAASLPLTFLNAFQGVDPIQAATYHQGDTVEVDDNIYIYTANVSASVATSAVPTDSRFRNLTEGGSTPVGNHSRYLALGADAVFTESDYTSGTEFMSDTVTFPTFLGHLFPGVVVPDTDPITTFTQLGVINQDISGFFVQIADIDIGGTTHNQWVGTQAFPDSYAGVQMRVS